MIISYYIHLMKYDIWWKYMNKTFKDLPLVGKASSCPNCMQFTYVYKRVTINTCKQSLYYHEKQSLRNDVSTSETHSQLPNALTSSSSPTNISLRVWRSDDSRKSAQNSSSSSALFCPTTRHMTSDLSSIQVLHYTDTVTLLQVHANLSPSLQCL